METIRNKIIVLAKIKFDLRDPDETYFAKYEIESLLNEEVEPVKTIPSLFKSYPFNELTDEIIHIITRSLYLGEIQGYLTSLIQVDIEKLIYRPAFFKEIYLIMDGSNYEKTKVNLSLKSKDLYQVFEVNTKDGKKLFVIRLFPVQTLFEYVTDVKKLPEVAITPKNRNNLDEYLSEKEKGIEKGLNELIEHLRNNYYRAPHFGLGKRHIGDFVDWASIDLRKPFLHYLHKYKGKGDPRISRALINLLRVNRGDTILDPFVGSGAFVADAPTMGLNAIGIEILNIGEFISEAKCNLNYDLKKLRKEIINLFTNISQNADDLFTFNLNTEIEKTKIKIKKLTDGNRFYINVLPHLYKIIYLKNKIREIKDNKIKNFLLVLLSQKIVEFSEKKRSNNFIVSFKNYVEDRYLTLYATLKLSRRINVNIGEGEVKIIKADSTQMDYIKDSSIDGILTSPPYFDALDYIGNNKMSIIILDFDEDLKLGSTKDYYSKFRNYDIALPESSRNLIELLKKSRRSMKSQIVENYLKMMKLSFKECYRVLKPGRFYAMVVSKYHTWMINGKEEKIDTSNIIRDIGVSVGFRLDRIIQHGLSKADKGKINVEDILLFQK